MLAAARMHRQCVADWTAVKLSMRQEGGPSASGKLHLQTLCGRKMEDDTTCGCRQSRTQPFLCCPTAQMLRVAVQGAGSTL